MFKEEWFIHADDREKNLHVTRPPKKKSESLSPCNMTPDDVDYEMSTGKNPKTLSICGMNQESFEYFIQHYGSTYEYLDFFKCQAISDFSPLAQLRNLQAVNIYWNIRAAALWDMSGNDSLKYLSLLDCKKLTYELPLLRTARDLEVFRVAGGNFTPYHMKSLSCFTGMTNLQSIWMYDIKLDEHDWEVLDTLPKLERFDFAAGMLTTEEIAYLVARYPRLTGKSLCAYNTEDASLSDVRICGYRKPSLNLPEQQHVLDKYVQAFDALVAKYKEELPRIP